MEQLENEIFQFHKDKPYTPTFFFRRNKTFPDGFAPIRQIVNYAKDKYNFNYFTFHTRALIALRNKLGQKHLDINLFNLVMYQIKQTFQNMLMDFYQFHKKCNLMLNILQLNF